MSLATRFRALVALCALLPLAGCLFHSHRVDREVSTFQLETATQSALIDFLNSQAAKIRTMQATVDIDTSVGGAKKGTVTEYTQIRGYVLARKPAMLRMIGLMPIVRTRAFDMVSDGRDFKLSIPPKNRFVIGRNDIEGHNSAQPLENLRPQVIYDAMLVGGIEAPGEIGVLEDDSEAEVDAKGRRSNQPNYVIDVIRMGKGGAGWFLSRKIAFSRLDLLPRREVIYDGGGGVATDTRYDLYKDAGEGIRFPWKIEIKRPQEEYDITLSIVKLELNQPLGDEKFFLEQPPGAYVVRLDQPNPTSLLRLPAAGFLRPFDRAGAGEDGGAEQ